MKIQFYLAVLAITSALSIVATEASADQVPRDKQGIWSAGSCGGEDYTLLVGPDRVMVLNGDNGGYGPVVGAANFTVDTIVMISENSAHILPSLDDLTRCPELPKAQREAYREEIAAFRVIYSPPYFSDEQRKIIMAVQSYRFGVKENRPEAARKRFQSAANLLNAIDTIEGSFARRIWYASNASGITVEGEGDTMFMDLLRGLMLSVSCRGAKMQEVTSTNEVIEMLSTMGGKFCLTVEGITDLGDPFAFTSSVDCSSSSGGSDFCGLSLFSDREVPTIEDVEYDSFAQRSGLDWDQKILAVGALP